MEENISNMSEGRDKPTPQEVVDAADAAQDACLTFEIMRRKVFRHINWTYLMPLPERSKRSDGVIWAQLFGNCVQCHERHAQMTKKAYYMWHAYCPFVCAHRLLR